ncbi:sensor histidine kinase [Ramlibacter monticola]|uniref:histidine kinase n=1 Tax=Ramlibacter monticola TaxID=1926872 RepID=A0A936Z1Y0_9BURK|nr:sensor histidine kinase [Ramlibacter monticola]MBL0392811.1 sensor histidine kinase [Ramlibacter monticola]
MRARRPFNLSRQFLVASLPIVLAGMLVIGWYVGQAIERAVTHRLAAVTSLYVDSFIAPHLQTLATGSELPPDRRAALDRLLTDTPLGRKIVAFKIWSRGGRILYSTNPTLIGREFPVDDGLREALEGRVHTSISDLDESENELERPHWSRLIETYSPVHAEGLGTVLAAAEFYQTTAELAQEILLAQAASWLVVGGSMLAMYLLLFGVVHRGSETIASQRDQLNAKIRELSAVVEQNQALSESIRLAAVRTTTLNEKFLRRIGADLHDGAAQDLALGLMRFESVAERWGGSAPAEAGARIAEEIPMIRSSLQSALRELRATSTGLQVPEIDRLDAVEIAARAVQDFQRKTGSRIALSHEGEAAQPCWPVKITMYRLIQEALGNGLRHGAASCLQVAIACDAESIRLDVRDNGCGFDPAGVDATQHLGLAGMRERVELLRGSVSVSSAPGHGTLVRACLPMTVEGYA